MYIADLHIHSHYSRATSRDCTPEYLDLWARRKGITIVGAGDFTHPAWRNELQDKLTPDGEGLYVLKDEYRIHDEVTPDAMTPHFAVTGEISTIYKKNDKVRKIHSLILLPDLTAAELLSSRLEEIGNLHSDGRPILGLDCRDLLEITLDACPDAIFVPAHIWTPHFSLFGAFSGFDAIEECFGDLTSHIHAVETGLSSDPPMNRRLSALDGYHLISNSDAHSPAKLGREANLLDITLSYQGLYRAIQQGKGLAGTIEFFPEEGKYHFDGHRKCNLSLTPSQAEAYGGICPVCGRKLTVGVLHRVEQLADRGENPVLPGALPYESLVPLPEVIAASTGRSAAGRKVQAEYEDMLRRLGDEFNILRTVPLEDIRSAAGSRLAEGIKRLRLGQVDRIPGYDGQYGVIRLFDRSEMDKMDSTEGQISLFSAEELAAYRHNDAKPEAIPPYPAAETDAAGSPADAPVTPAGPADGSAAVACTAGEFPGLGTPEISVSAMTAAFHPDTEQIAAITTPGRAVAVIAGPGTGKTGTLIARIRYLIERRGVKPAEITAVTFTNKAADEIRARLLTLPEGRRRFRSLTVGTFHAICHQLLTGQGRSFTLADELETLELAQETVQQFHLKTTAARFLKEISLLKTGLLQESGRVPVPARAYYEEQLRKREMMDFDDLLIEGCRLISESGGERERLCRPFRFLLVDEFQDVSPLEYRLLGCLRQTGKELFVIGDPDQSIYSFRGADADCFYRLADDIPQLVRITLRNNYRSTPEILSCGLHVIAHNKGGARHLRAVSPAGPAVRLVTAPSDFSEAIYVAKQINRLVGGIDMLDTETSSLRPRAGSFSDIAVLYRTHRQARVLEKCLGIEGIPYVVAGKDDFLMETAVRGTICFLRFLRNPGDTLAKSLFIRLLFHGEPAAAQPLIDKYAPLIAKAKPQKLLESWACELGLSDDEGLRKLCRTALFYKNLPSFLDSLILGQEGDIRRSASKSYTSDAVTLMTLHAAKGLEYPVIFLFGIEKGLLPLETGNSVQNPEEERRLFYVGVTRARNELYLLTGKEPSPFLQEIPDTLLEKATAGRQEPTDTGEMRQLSLFEL